MKERNIQLSFEQQERKILFGIHKYPITIRVSVFHYSLLKKYFKTLKNVTLRYIVDV